MGRHALLFALLGLGVIFFLRPGEVAAAGCDPSNIIFSELDYDQPDPDSTEFLELQFQSAAVVSQCEIHFVNGLDDSLYRSVSLAGTYGDGEFVLVGSDNLTPDISLNCSTHCIQNGGAHPDGIALVDTSGTSATVVEFIAYDFSGSLTYMGVTSTHIGCSENNSTPNLSCQNGPIPGHGDWSAGTPTPEGTGPTAVGLSTFTTDAGSAPFISISLILLLLTWTAVRTVSRGRCE